MGCMSSISSMSRGEMQGYCGAGGTCEAGSRPSPVTAGTSDRRACMVKGGDLGGLGGGWLEHPRQ